MKTSHIDFIGYKTPFIVLSVLLVVVSLGLFFSKGLNYGIDFLGGTEVQLKFAKETAPEAVREALAAVNMAEASVQVFGDPKENEFLIRVQSASSGPQHQDEQLRAAVTQLLSTEQQLLKIRYAGDKAYLIFNSPIDAKGLLAALKQREFAGLVIYDLTPFGKESEHEYLMHFSGVSKLISDGLTEQFGAESFELRREDSVGPKVGSELRQKGIASILLAMLFILIYIWMRFDLTFAPGAIVALFHDVLITIGVFTLFEVEVNLPVVAALLTIVGYSLNDTIVVYDRIRENMKGKKSKELSQLINLSINQTISRTVMTSVTTLLVTTALLIFGGAIIHNFALALTLGVIVGTYSSIFIASPMVIFLTRYAELRRVKAA